MARRERSVDRRGTPRAEEDVKSVAARGWNEEREEGRGERRWDSDDERRDYRRDRRSEDRDRRGGGGDRRDRYSSRRGRDDDRRDIEGKHRGRDGDGRGGYADRGGDYRPRQDRDDDRRDGYDDRRGGYDDRRGGYDDRRGEYDDRRGRYEARRSRYDDRRGGYDDQRGRYGDRRREGGEWRDEERGREEEIARGIRDGDGVGKRRAWLDEEEAGAFRGRRGSGFRDIWGRSPSPPARLEDRLEVGGDERRKREKKRERKEERRKQREAKRARREARVVGGDSVAVAAEVSGDVSKEPAVGRATGEDDDDDDDEGGVIGPALPAVMREGMVGKEVDYGKALRPGEGTAMAAFVQDGERIPRRGEIGLKSEQIEAFEKQGYVMSGSRNRRMEAVRIRKENQVYSAEELAALGQYNHEEKLMREKLVHNQFKQLVESKMGAAIPPENSTAGATASAAKPPRAA